MRIGGGERIEKGPTIAVGNDVKATGFDPSRWEWASTNPIWDLSFIQRTRFGVAYYQQVRASRVAPWIRLSRVIERGREDDEIQDYFIYPFPPAKVLERCRTRVAKSNG